MSDSEPYIDIPRHLACDAWAIRVIERPEFSVDGVEGIAEGAVTIPWSTLSRAFVAEVGEPEGVRAVVFDLAQAGADPGPTLWRFGIDPYDAPKLIAQWIVEALGSSRCSLSLLTLAKEGVPTQFYTHLVDWDDLVLAELLA